MSHRSRPEDLALHGVRVLGHATGSRVAARYDLDPAAVQEELLDAEAHGWVRRRAFADDAGWSMTAAGRQRGEQVMAAELERAGARNLVTAAHAAFLPLNHRFTAVCTDWQLRPVVGDRRVANDHTDAVWDDRVLTTLTSMGIRLGAICEALTRVLARFGPYRPLYSQALAKVEAGDPAWLDAPGRDSVHLVWIQLHEDLIATLGLRRADEGSGSGPGGGPGGDGADAGPDPDLGGRPTAP